MKPFFRLVLNLEDAADSKSKVSLIVAFLKSATPEDSALAVKLLLDKQTKRFVDTSRMKLLCQSYSGLPPWLIDECLRSVGDLAETVALVVPETKLADVIRQPFSAWFGDRVAKLGTLDFGAQLESIGDSWSRLEPDERIVFNRLVMGTFRPSCSPQLVALALAELGALPVPAINHRLARPWLLNGEGFAYLVASDLTDVEMGLPYPFCGQVPFGPDVASLGDPTEWICEWKWDGIRAQVVKRDGTISVWTKSHTLITPWVKDIAEAAALVPDGTVLDGVVVAWFGDVRAPASVMAQRLERKANSKSSVGESVTYVAFDTLEFGGIDYRHRPYSERRDALDSIFLSLEGEGVIQEDLMAPLFSGYRISKTIPKAVGRWDDVPEATKDACRDGAHGVVLKRLASTYGSVDGRDAWQVALPESHCVDAVLMYVERGAGIDASSFTHVTVGAWRGSELVPIAKVAVNLTGPDAAQLETFVKENTLERFGPVRTVRPELAVALSFQSVEKSTRRKSGIVLIEPVIEEWKWGAGLDGTAQLEDVARRTVAGDRS